MKTDLVSEALTGLRKVAFRQETVEFKKDYYVDGNIVDGLMGPNWQIIYGRRGTGKTTTLYALKDRINTGNNDLRSIAVYVDLTTCTPSDHGGSADIDAQRYAASLYFQDFIKKVCTELYESYTSADNHGLLRKLFSRDDLNKDRAEDIILDIQDVVENGRFIQTPSTKTVVHENVGADNASLGVSAGVEKALPTAKVNASLGGNDTAKQTSSFTYVFTEAGKYRYLSEKLAELIDVLKLDNIVILIDEWTSLDKSGKLEIQAIFAELLKTTLGPIRGLSVKISAIRGTSVFFRRDNETLIGLEPDDDIYEGEDLDRAYSKQHDGNRFFETLIFKKMLEHQPKLVEFSEQDADGAYTFNPQQGFIQSFFKDENAFDEIVEASGRIPRLFVELFSEVTKVFNFSIQPKWDRRTIVDQIVYRSAIKRRDIVPHAKLGRFYQAICKVVKRTDQRAFLVPHSEMRVLHGVVSDLFHFRFLHNIERQSLLPEIDSEYRAFYIDYGSFLEVTKNHKNDDYSLSQATQDDLFAGKRMDKYVVSAGDVDLNVGICSECNRVISLTHDLVVNLSACYLCNQKTNIQPVR